MEESTKFEGLHTYEQAANYLSALQIYLNEHYRPKRKGSPRPKPFSRDIWNHIIKKG